MKGYKDDISYLHRHNQKELLASILDGSFNASMYVHELVLTKTYDGVSFLPRFDSLIDVDMRIRFSSSYIKQQIFIYNPTIRSLHIKSLGRSSCTRGFVRGMRQLELLSIDDKEHPITLEQTVIELSKLKTLVYRGNHYIFSESYHTTPSDSPLLDTIVLDSDTLISLVSTSWTNKNLAFKSGGTGGTIYIPKSLYDHLGDGTEYDYRSATNWSTVDARGTITWAQIEGSEYELT